MYKIKRTKGYRLFLNCLLSSIQLGLNRNTYQKNLKHVYGDYIPPIKEVIEDFRTIELKFPRQMGKTLCLVEAITREPICTDNKVAMIHWGEEFRMDSQSTKAIDKSKNCFDFKHLKAEEFLEIINNNKVVIVSSIGQNRSMVFVKELIDHLQHQIGILAFDINKLPLFVVVK